MALSRPFKEDRLALPLSMPLFQAIDGVMSLDLWPQVVSQASQHFRSCEKPATCESCFAHQSICFSQLDGTRSVRNLTVRDRYVTLHGTRSACNRSRCIHHDITRYVCNIIYFTDRDATGSYVTGHTSFKQLCLHPYAIGNTSFAVLVPDLYTIGHISCTLTLPDLCVIGHTSLTVMLSDLYVTGHTLYFQICLP